MLQKPRQEDEHSYHRTPNQQSGNYAEPVYPVVNKISKSIEKLLEKNQALSTIIDRKEQELKELKSQLAQAGKLAALGTLGATVVHELNNPLTVVAAEADDLIETPNISPEDIQRSAQNIKSCASRMQEIVSYILRHARDDRNSKWSKINPNTIIQNALVILQRQLDSSGITVNKNLQHDLPDIWGHASQLESVVQNLISNSRDALLSVNHDQPKLLLITTAQHNTNSVQLTVSDNGCGISEDIQAKIFKPFFTTKPAGKGTGLGMAIALGIISEHNGDIRLRSQKNVGTEFVITFPLDRRTIDSGNRNGR